MPTLKKIVVQDFRNIAFQELSFSPNVNCISGSNGAGKTNLLDAIYYLSMTKSAFQAPDRANWRFGTQGFVVGGTYAMENGLESQFSLRVGEDGKRLVRDEKPCPRMSEHIGLLPVVMVSPSDSVLVSDAGEDRRRLANAVLSQMDREYLAAVQAYNRLLAQRNKILKEDRPDLELLGILDQRMSPLANTVYQSRLRLTEELLPVVSRFYQLISGGADSAFSGQKSVHAVGSVTAETYYTLMAAAPATETVRGQAEKVCTRWALLIPICVSGWWLLRKFMVNKKNERKENKNADRSVEE